MKNISHILLDMADFYHGMSDSKSYNHEDFSKLTDIEELFINTDTGKEPTAFMYLILGVLTRERPTHREFYLEIDRLLAKEFYDIIRKHNLS